MIGVIIQARLGSTRTPGKTMKFIAGKPLLYYSVYRASLARCIEKVIVATTTNPLDDTIVKWCETRGIPYYRGSEEDVLDRYYQTARNYKLDIVVRVTSDCPFVDPEIIDLLVSKLKENDADYVSNRLEKRTWPHGLDVEVFKFSALEKAWKEAKGQREREHVTPYIMEHPEYFRQVEIQLDRNLSNFRLTVDYPEDIEFTKVLIEKFNAEKMNWKEIVQLLEKHPELVAINAKRIDTKL